MGTAEDIGAIIEELVDLEPESFTWESPWSHGTIQHSERLFSVASYAVRFPGDLAEIGCMAGATTARLGAIAQAYDRRVLAIDPWETGTQNCAGWEYQAFLDNTAVVKGAIDVFKMRSQSEQARKALALPLCFAFVDGSHEYEDCLSDILAVAHAAVICVDDWLWSGAVKMAFEECAGRLGRVAVTNDMAKEGYLI